MKLIDIILWSLIVGICLLLIQIIINWQINA